MGVFSQSTWRGSMVGPCSKRTYDFAAGIFLLFCLLIFSVFLVLFLS